MHGALAQLGACHTGSVEVTGSNPVCSIFLFSNKHLQKALALSKCKSFVCCTQFYFVLKINIYCT